MRSDDLMLRQMTLGLLRLSRAYRVAADQAASAFGLSHATAWPLVVIGRTPEGARPGAVAEAVEIEPSSLVRVIDQLVQAGLVAREEDPQDRRARILRLTPAGRERARALEEAMVLLRRRLFEAASRTDIEATLRVFAVLETSLAEPERQNNPD
jgi:MarR family transcriptional regulator for hemolysin